MKEIRVLSYKFQNPYCSCESVYINKKTNRYYILQPCQNKGEQRLLTCYPSRGYYEADSPVRAGLQYEIEGKVVTTLEEGIIRDEEVYNEWQNEELSLYRLKEEYKTDERYECVSSGMISKLYDWCEPDYFEKVVVKRKQIERIFNKYYMREGEN